MNDAFFCKVQKYEQLYNEYKNDYVEVKKIKNELRNQLEEQNIINQELQSAENEKNNLEHQLRNKRKKDKQKCESGIQKCDNSLMNLLTKQKNDLKNELDTNEKNIALFNKNAVKDMSAAFVSQIVEREEDDFNRNKARKIQLDEKIVATEQEIRLIEKNNDELSTLSMEDIKQDIDYLKNKGGKISEY